jgi:pentatricopeptide repeat protein
MRRTLGSGDSNEERLHFRALAFWERIVPSSASYAALLSVFASVGKWDGMLGLLERMDKEMVNAQVLGTAYNCMRRDRKMEIEQWARTNRPNVWKFLESIR